MSRAQDINVVGGELQRCGTGPTTGFYRDDCCATGSEDLGSHTVCALVTREFLEFSERAGNPLATPRPEFGFPGLEPGDAWCVCASRWLEAEHAGVAPPVNLAATHRAALEVVPIDVLVNYAADRGP